LVLLQIIPAIFFAKYLFGAMALGGYQKLLEKIAASNWVGMLKIQQCLLDKVKRFLRTADFGVRAIYDAALKLARSRNGDGSESNASHRISPNSTKHAMDRVSCVGF